MNNTTKTNYDKYLEKQMRDSEFRKAYEEELRRLRFAHKVMQLRKEEKLSQKEFAEKINTTQSVVSRIEHGSQNITVDYLERIANIFGRELVVDFEKRKKQKLKS
ncbi:MAG: helix-turn-helix transcriptional regulator [Candidatus Spechtbacterales bacterium]